MRFDALLIDLDGVIRRWSDSDASVEQAFGLPVGSIRKVAFSGDLLRSAVLGEITDEQWRKRIAEILEHEYSVPAATEAVERWSAYAGAVDADALSLLAACEPGLRLVLVTNATSRLRADLATLGLTERFHAVVSSSEIGIAKPDERFYRAALISAAAEAERVLYVDDTPANVASASGLGIRSHVFVDADRLQSFLQEAGVLHASARFPFVEP
jgi:putative hydrolase of the HAD superfamily